MRSFIGSAHVPAEYEDYLAYTCLVLKGANMDDMKCEVEKLDWQVVAEEVRKEEATLVQEKKCRLPISPIPYLDDIAKAAQRLGYKVDLVRYQIVAYADRNNFCHSGIKSMIHHADFEILAQRIMENKRFLKIIFGLGHFYCLRRWQLVIEQHQPRV